MTNEDPGTESTGAPSGDAGAGKATPRSFGIVPGAVRVPSPEPGPAAAREASHDELVEWEHLLRLRSLRRARATFSWVVLGVMVVWMMFVGVVVWRSGDGANRFDVSDTVLTALIAGATVNVIGLFLAVLGFLFPKGGDPA